MKTWTTMDKTKWDDGPWKDEPDKAHWVDETTGLDCLIVRNRSGALCGYVGVPKNHPYYKKDYDQIECLEVHHGLTFSDTCSDVEDESIGICHPKSGSANEEVWWLGFDCGHADDVIPTYSWSFGFKSIYRDFNYVKSEVENLARQLSNV